MGITLVAIMIASVFAMVAPTAVADPPNPPGPYPDPDVYPNSTIRIYGDVPPKGNAPERYSDWTQPFDPTVIPKDSIMFNPAILEWDGDKYPMSAQSNNSDLKTYLRAWYEPCGKYWGLRKNHTYPTINLEYTYMLLESQDKMPWHADVGSQFAFPICEIKNQTGLGAFENELSLGSWASDPNLVTLSDVRGSVPSSYNKSVDGTIAIQKEYYLKSGEKIQFMDHKLEYIGTDTDVSFAVVRVWYAGNMEDDSGKVVKLPTCQTKYFKRHNEMSDSFSEGYPWFAHFEDKMQGTHEGIITVGRYLWNSAVFYVDGVRYDVTAVEVLDMDGDEDDVEKFKYITLRTKLPKCMPECSVQDESVVSSQRIDCIALNETIPVLPPFNMKNHSIVDDIDIPLWAPLTNEGEWPEGNPSGVLGAEYFPCAEKYLTQQYPPAQWQTYFEAVPIGVGIPCTMWDGPYYPSELPMDHWVMDVCGEILPAPEPDDYEIFDTTNWIAMDVEARIIPDVEPLVVYYIAETEEERLSTNLLEKLNEIGIGTEDFYENWTKFDIQTLPDQYTEMVLPEIPDLNVTNCGYSQELHGDYLITTSLIAPISRDGRPTRGGDFPGARVAFSYDIVDGMDGIDIYVNSDPKDTTKNVTVRIYGDVNPAAPRRYTDWEQPFNPTVIRKDSITFDAAKLEWDGDKYPMSGQSENVALKEYLRAWYEPCYEFSKEKLPAVVTEITYMLLDHLDEKPWHGSAGDTWFAFPIAENESTPDTQIGLELFENVQGEPLLPNLVSLALVSTKDDEPVGEFNKTVKGKIRIQKSYFIQPGKVDTVQFLDHKVRFIGEVENASAAKVQIGYAGNKVDDTWTSEAITLNRSETYWFDRHNVMYDEPNHQTHPVRTFYIHYEGKMQGTHEGIITIGKELEWSDIFYVDSVRYEVVAIEVFDSDDDDDKADKFKYITLRTPFPKDPTNSTFCTMTIDDGSWIASSQWITMIPPCHPIPVLPPMSMEHLIVDDTDVVLWQPLKHWDNWPEGDEDGVPGIEYFPCAERYLTMQYPPYPWLKYFRAIPIGVPEIPHDWELWESYGGPWYPGNEVPDNWKLCKCGIIMEAPDEWTVFDDETWIANDVAQRVIGPIGPLEFCWLNESKEPRYSTNLLQILDENVTGIGPVEEGWTKYDIQTLPDMYTEFKLPVIPSVNPVCRISGLLGGFKPDVREYPGSYLITTSFFAPNAKGDLNLNQTYQQGNRYAFTFNASDGWGIYMNEDPPVEPIECGWQFHLYEGVDYLSLPAIPPDPSVDAVFGDAGITVKWYNPATGFYEPVTVLEAGKGYKITCADEKVRDITGENVGITWAMIKENLQPGWNLVGLGDTDVTNNAYQSDPIVVRGWDAETDSWYTVQKGKKMHRGNGYFIEYTP